MSASTGTQPPARVSEEALASFRETVRLHYRLHGRDLPWRRTRDPYHILVSEFMLQQTQVPRVLPKYRQFLALFPSVQALAVAPKSRLLGAWQGLGYNRRALNLRRSAEIIVHRHAGDVPRRMPDLLALPGVGPATAAAVSAFAFDIAIPFLETNIRAAYIHHFFQECSRVSDAELLPLVEATLDRDDPREWYYALMDYGNHLKRTHSNPARRSAHASRQRPFEGSHRQLRASILRLFLEECGGGTPPGDDQRSLTTDVVKECLPGWDPGEIVASLEEMTAEGFFVITDDGYRLP